jgi:predicted DCC family thiol-disulfide oxidoreductase YuxK
MNKVFASCLTDDRPLVLYDAECGTCSKLAHWASNSALFGKANYVASQSYSDERLRELGLNRSDCDEELVTIVPSQQIFRGSDAVAVLLLNGPLAFAGHAMLDWPIVERIASGVYRTIARHRKCL